MNQTVTIATEQKLHDIKTEADRLFAERVHWSKFHDVILGVNGLVRSKLEKGERTLFYTAESYAEILKQLKYLRERRTVGDLPKERVITVRIPESLHESLREESHENRISMNKLCISKLVQHIDSEYIPDERSAGL